MKNIMVKILAFVLMINTVSFVNIKPAFANKKLNNSLNFEWIKGYNLDENFDAKKSDEGALFRWDLEQLGGNKANESVHTLKYPIEDKKKIEIKADYKNGSVEIEYKVNNTDKDDDNNANTPAKDDYGNKVDKKYNSFEIWKNNGFSPANDKNFPDNGDIVLTSKYTNGKAKAVKVKIKKGVNLRFKYQENIVALKWNKDGKIYFASNNFIKGKIYNFDLNVKKDNKDNKVGLKIFKGIDTDSNKFEVKPYANATQGNTDGKDTIDQLTRPKVDEDPGSPERGIKITFDAPKEWNDKDSLFEKVGDTTSKNATNLDLRLNNNNKVLQIQIDNIYKATGVGNIVRNDTSKISAEHSYNATNDKVTIVIKNLEASILYKSTLLEVSRPKNAFESYESEAPFGKVYTYPIFRIVSSGENEFYMEIEPFKGYDGIYTIYKKDKKLVDYEEKEKGKEIISIPLSLSATAPNEDIYKVGFSTVRLPDMEKDKILSQNLNYKPHDEDVVLSTPNNFKILESNIVREDKNGKKEENLFLKLSWDIGYKDTINKLREQIKQNPAKSLSINYEILKGVTPDTPTDKFTGVKINFLKNIGDNITDDIGNIEFVKNNPDNNIKFENEKSKLHLTKKNFQGKPKTVVTAEIMLKIPVSNKADKVFTYPSVYFLSIQGNYKIDNKEAKINKSLPISLTLDGVSDIGVPAPQNADITKVKNRSFDINYDTLKYKNKGDVLYNYNKIMLETIGKKLGENSISYDFYVSQDRKIFEDMINFLKDKNDEDLTEKYPDDVKNKVKVYEYKGASVKMQDEKDKDGNSLINILRDKNIVKIKNVPQIDKNEKNQTITFEQLDENETYYIIGMTKIVPYSKDDNKLLEKEIDTSKYCKIVTATTRTGEDEPTDNEKIPTAPTYFKAKDISTTSANLFWNRVQEVQDESDKSILEYQFIQTRGNAMSEKVLKSRDSFEKTWDNLSHIGAKKGIRTDDDKIYEFDKNTKDFSSIPSNNYEYLSYAGEEGNILDKTLLPNKVYFYYVRTVRIVDGKDTAYSVWVPLTFTTKNVASPTNLRVEQNADYDKKSEVVISFDIPKIDMSLLGKEYELQYSIREETDDWQDDKNMEKEKITFLENSDKKTIRVTYKITGLKSGKMYTIRVRMLNKVLNSTSIYSNEVDYRTNTDNEDNDYDQDVEDLEKHFKDLINKLRNSPYWFLKNNASVTDVYYRPQYFDSILSSVKAGNIQLISGNGKYKQYYLPASAVVKAFEQNKGFKISYGKSDIIFSAKSINPNTNLVIKSIVDNIKSKNGKLEDYFIKLTVDFKDASYNIYGEASISPYVNVVASVEGLNKTVASFDKSMVDYINELLNKDKFSKNLKEIIKELVKNNVENVEMIRELNNLLDDFKEEFGEEIAKDIDKIIKKSLYIKTLDNNLIFTYPYIKGAYVNGYKMVNGNWNILHTAMYQNKNAIFTKELSSFIFTGKKLVINGLGNLQNADKIKDIVIKYGLDDYLFTNGEINLKGHMTRNMVVGSLARIGGAIKTSDPIQFFKSKNVVIPNRNIASNMSAEETVYLMMKTYEIRTGTKINNIKIKNYKLASNIKNINKKYKKAIQIAFDMGIYTNQNMNAKGTITVEQFLNSIANMSNIINI